MGQSAGVDVKKLSTEQLGKLANCLGKDEDRSRAVQCKWTLQQCKHYYYTMPLYHSILQYDTAVFLVKGGANTDTEACVRYCINAGSRWRHANLHETWQQPCAKFQCSHRLRHAHLGLNSIWLESVEQEQTDSCDKDTPVQLLPSP